VYCKGGAPLRCAAFLMPGLGSLWKRKRKGFRAGIGAGSFSARRKRREKRIEKVLDF